MIQCYNSLAKCRRGLDNKVENNYIEEQLDEVIEEISNNYSEWGDIKESIRQEIVSKLKRIKKMLKEIKKC